MRKDDKFNIFVYDIKYRKQVCRGDWGFTCETRVGLHMVPFPLLRAPPPRMIGLISPLTLRTVHISYASA